MFKNLIFLFVCLSVTNISAQQRYLDSVFTAYDFTSDIQYGSNIDYNGVNQNLLLDLYQPDGDTLAARPLIIFMHGGGFKSGSKYNMAFLKNLQGYTLMGYVVASIDYRLGISQDPDGNNKALYRAVQDAKAAIRFFKRYKDVYKIDTSMIVIAGESAGSHAAIHTAFWNASEVPSGIDTVALGNLEGNSGNPGYSSRVAAIINCWGAIRDTNWMQADEPMIVSIHGIDDTIVSIYESQVNYVTPQYGSAIIDRVADSIGLTHALRLFADAGHSLVGTNTSDVVYRLDTALLFTAEFLYCNMIIKCFDTLTTASSNIIKQLNATDLVLYPNPTNSNITCQLNNDIFNEPLNIKIFSINGELIKELQMHSSILKIDLSDFSKGVYFIKLISDTMAFNKKIVLD